MRRRREGEEQERLGECWKRSGEEKQEKSRIRKERRKRKECMRRRREGKEQERLGECC